MKKSISLLIINLLFVVASFAQYAAQVDKLINQYYQENQPGIALAIIKDGKTIYQNEVGLANLEYQIPLSDSSAFQIASVSKQFTAYLALILEQKGKLSLKEDMRKYLPELKHLPFKITLAQLANHTHGLPNVTELANIKGFGISDRPMASGYRTNSTSYQNGQL